MVVFQAKLGTMADKTKRIICLTELIAKELNLPSEQREKVLRCAELCKADLVTNMLGEKNLPNSRDILVNSMLLFPVKMKK
jgi:glycyl-tRNA synthetase beta chain